MSTTVDNRIVNMQFNNKDFEKGVKQTVQSLDNLKKSLDIEESAKGVKEVQKEFKQFKTDKMEKALETVQQRFSVLGEIGAAAIHKLTNAVIDFGAKAIKETLIAPLTDGFKEYELKMDSVQNIMNGTGESLERVNEKLDELNHYADKTIYSFSDMTSNIGKFTNAGVKLDDAVDAIQGVANVAALAGANSQQASHAMYNFAQALSSGSVKLIDWKSIENANMATQEFKNTLIETALELGTVVKQEDKYVSTTTNAKGEISDAFDATRGFNDSLNHQWMTTEVLTSALKKYTDETTTLGKRAFAAATEVKTFSQLLDTLKEALGSGWASSWEKIIGDFNEAKVLWTKVNDVLSGLISTWDDWRNGLLDGWREMKGREQLIAAFTNSFYSLKRILSPISQAFLNIFPPITAQTLKDATDNLYNFIRVTMIGNGAMTNLRRIFQGVFSVVNFGVEAFKALLEVFAYVGNDILKILAPFGVLLGYFGNYLTNVIKMAEKTGVLSTMANNLARGFHTLGVMVAKAIVAISKYINRIRSSKSFDSIVQMFQKLFTSLEGSTTVFDIVLYGIDRLLAGLLLVTDVIFNLLPSFDTVKSALTLFGYAVLVVADQIVSGFTTAFNFLKNIFTNLINMFGQVGNWFNDIWVKFFGNFDLFKEAGNLIQNVAKVAGSGLEGLGNIIIKLMEIIGQIGSVSWEGFTKASRAISDYIGDDTIFNMQRFKKILTSVLLVMAAYDFVKFANGLASIPAAITKLLNNIATVPSKLSNVLGSLSDLLDSWNTKKKSLAESVTDTIMSIAKSMFIMASAITMLSMINVEKAITGLIALFAALVGLTVLALVINGALKKWGNAEDGFGDIISSIYDMSKAIFILSLALTQFTKLYSGKDTDPVDKALFAIIGLMLTMGATAFMMSKSHDIENLKDLVTSMATGILVMSFAIEKLGNIPIDRLGMAYAAVEGLMMTMALMLTYLSTMRTYNLMAVRKIFNVFLGVIAGLALTVGALTLFDKGNGNLWNATFVVAAIEGFLVGMFSLFDWMSGIVNLNVSGLLATVHALSIFSGVIAGLALTVAGLSLLPQPQLVSAMQIMESIGGFLAVVGLVLGGVVVLVNKFSVGGIAQLITVVEALRHMVYSIAILLAVTAVAGAVMKGDEMRRVLKLMTLLLIELVGTALILSMLNTASVMTGALGMVAMAGAIAILVGAAIMLTTQDWNKMSKAVFYIIALGGILGLMAYAISTFTVSTDILATGAAMIMMATSVVILAEAVLMLSTVDPIALNNSVIALLEMGGILVALSAGIALINKYLMSDNIALIAQTMGMVLAMAGAIVVVSYALTILQNVDAEKIQGGILALAEALGIMVVLVALCGVFSSIAVPGITAILGIAGALIAVALAFDILINLNWLAIPGTVAAAINTLIAVLSTDAIVQAIEILIEDICIAIQRALPVLVNTLVYAAEVLLDAAISLIGWIGKKLSTREVQQKLDEAIWSLVFGVVGFFVSLIFGSKVGTQISKAGQHFVGDFAESLGTEWNKFVAAFTGLIQTGVEFWLGFFGVNAGGINNTPSYKAGQYFMLSLAAGFYSSIADIMAPFEIIGDFIQSFIDSYMNFDFTDPDKMKKWAIEMTKASVKLKVNWAKFTRGEKVTTNQKVLTYLTDKFGKLQVEYSSKAFDEQIQIYNDTLKDLEADTAFGDDNTLFTEPLADVSKEDAKTVGGIVDSLSEKYGFLGDSANQATEGVKGLDDQLNGIKDKVSEPLKALSKDTAPEAKEAGKETGKSFLDGMNFSLEGLKDKGGNIADTLKNKFGGVTDTVKGLMSGEKSLGDIDLTSFVSNADKLNSMFGGKIGFLSNITDAAKEFTGATEGMDIGEIMKGMDPGDMGDMFGDMFSDKQFQMDFQQNTGKELAGALEDTDMGKYLDTNKIVSSVEDSVNEDLSDGVKIETFGDISMKDMVLDDDGLAKNFNLADGSLSDINGSLGYTSDALGGIDGVTSGINKGVISTGDILASIEQVLVKIANKFGIAATAVSTMSNYIQDASDSMSELTQKEQSGYEVLQKTAEAGKSFTNSISTALSAFDITKFKKSSEEAKKSTEEYENAKKLIDEYEKDHSAYISKRMRDTGKDAVELSKETRKAYEVVEAYEKKSAEEAKKTSATKVESVKKALTAEEKARQENERKREQWDRIVEKHGKIPYEVGEKQWAKWVKEDEEEQKKKLSEATNADQEVIDKATESGRAVGKAFGTGAAKSASEVFKNDRVFAAMLLYSTEDFEKDFADDGELNASIRPVVDADELKKATENAKVETKAQLDTSVSTELADEVVLDYHKELGTIISGVDKLGNLIVDLKDAITSIKIVMDNGVLVGQVASGVQANLANNMIMVERGAI